MQRPMSVSRLKGNNKGPEQEKPREGTKMREVYDRLFEHAGRQIPFDFDPCILYALMNFYGLDVTRVQRKSFKKNTCSTCIRAGYWDGKTYFDCIAALMTPQSRE
jgi:hypothetical protein